MRGRQPRDQRMLNYLETDYIVCIYQRGVSQEAVITVS